MKMSRDGVFALDFAGGPLLPKHCYCDKSAGRSVDTWPVVRRGSCTWNACNAILCRFSTVQHNTTRSAQFSTNQDTPQALPPLPTPPPTTGLLLSRLCRTCSWKRGHRCSRRTCSAFITFSICTG